MIFGSIVAGLTSEGGGAVAFPVMTLALGVPPAVARDFSFAIQSFGMTCAAITIFGLGAPVDKEALIWASLGGAVGLAVGLEFVAPRLPPAYAKMLFVSLWAAFAVALYRLNQTKERKVFDSSRHADKNLVAMKIAGNQDAREKKIEAGEGNVMSSDQGDNGDEGESEAMKAIIQTRRSEKMKDVSSTSIDSISENIKAKRWRVFLICVMGIFGGVISSVAGSGIDMASFSILTLYFRVSEKVATPTSVILMAVNACLGIAFRAMGLGTGKIDGAVWDFLAVCIPIVVWGAPLGATIASYLHRLTISNVLYFLDTFQFVAALAIIKPWSKPFPNNVGLCVSSVATIVFGSLFFHVIAHLGEERDRIVKETDSKIHN
eukprot:CAMPEP_0171323538 /NCGR_PEP_ID=MMETSP0816-20121228/115639_1 /TAXON_ID=420281 /ORGANISM="Proboscia inermis, Strain CCAP1064/1" /LENGTH=375 /DNA_ID=CAMNT_0011822273 /DNA_START=161 /DNA_END=1288 /DNA_ORIENTATION=-